MNIRVDMTTGDHDVPASATDAGLDGERYRTAAQRGVHMAEFIPWLECSSEELQRCHVNIYTGIIVGIALN